EVRGADANWPGLALAVPAFWKGLLYDESGLAAAGEVAVGVAPGGFARPFDAARPDGPGGRCGRGAPRASDPGRPEMAAEGLRRQAVERGHPDERRFLEPVFAVLESGLSPGMEFPARGPAASDPAAVVDWFAC